MPCVFCCLKVFTEVAGGVIYGHDAYLCVEVPQRIKTLTYALHAEKQSITERRARDEWLFALMLDMLHEWMTAWMLCVFCVHMCTFMFVLYFR